MAVMQRLKCSANCGAREFDAMVERRTVDRVGKDRSGRSGNVGREKLIIIDKTPDSDGFPKNSEVDAICATCGAALEIRMMAFAIGGRAREVVGEVEFRRLPVELGKAAAHVGERHRFHDCGSDGDGSGGGEIFEATVQGPLVAPQVGPDGPKLVEVGGVAVRDDGRAFNFGPGCTHGAGSGSVGKPN